MKKSIKENFNRFYISLIIISIGAFFIHIKFNSPPNFEMFFTYLPLSWLLTFFLMCGFIIFLGDKE